MVRHFPHGRTTQARVSVTMALTASLLGALFAAPPTSSAVDDDHQLHHQQNRLDNHISNRAVDLDEISTRLVKAAARVDGAVTDLKLAKSELATMREQVRQAVIFDERMQTKLDDAVLRLEDATADLVQGREDVSSQRQAVTSYAVSTFQSGDLASSTLNIAFEATTPEQAFDQMQAESTVLDMQAVDLQEFEAAEVLLQLTEERVAATEVEVEDRRIDAANALETKQTLQGQAKTAKEQVATRVADLRSTKKQITAAKRQEIKRIAKLKKERDRVEERLQKIAERRARRANMQLKTPSQVQGTSGGYLSYPVSNTYITSPYGMRMHPILHVYKLHDGTDFGAACGTPVYAAAAGRIMSEYYNAGYGNRVIMDHGFVRGVSLQTSYNHLTSFVAGPGEYVKRGELIAYSGTTGYSTGCHLHFMVYVNGFTVDPVRWL